MGSIKMNGGSDRYIVFRQVFFWLGIVPIFFICLLFSSAVRSQDAPKNVNAAAPSYSALADLLENKQTRDQMITQLRSLAAKAPQDTHAGVTPKDDISSGAAAPPKQAQGSVSQRIADKIQIFSNSLFADFAATAAALRTLNQQYDAADTHKWMGGLSDFIIVLAATVLVFLIFRALAAHFYARLNRWVAQERAGAPRTAAWALTRILGAILGALAIDIATVVLAGIAGYAVALFVTGAPGVIDRPASLFINAFVAVEIAKALARLVFATRYEHLRLLTMADDVAIFWNRWLARLVGITGYGLLVAVPIVKMTFLPAVGQLLGLFIMLGVYVYAVRVIWTNRILLRDRLMRRADQASTAFFGTLIGVMARIWHVLAIGYFTVLFVVSQIEQQQALPFMARATLQTLLALALGLLLSAMATALLARRIRLSDELRIRLPMLEARINSYVPAVLKTVRTLILLVVALVVLDAWHAFNLSAWIASDDGRTTIAMIVHVAIILLIAALVWTVVASVIEHRLSIAPGRNSPSEREKTLLALFRNAALVVIVTMTILIVLSQIGINIGPLIAGAGVVGLAIGFGAQKLVQDVITGIFIQLENGMNQNDVVELCGLFGTVEKITIRSVVIRTLDGGYHLIPFSSVDKLTNHMRGFGYHYGEYNIAHRENADEVIAHLKRAFEELMQDPELAPLVLEEISIPGVTSLTERGFTIRVLIKTVPGMQWAIQRGFNHLVKKHFDAAGIELPYPQTVVHFGQDKSGHTASVNVRQVADNTN